MQPAELTKQACAVPVTLTDPSPLTPNCCVQSSYNTSLQVSLTKRLRWNMLRKDAELKSNLQRTFSGSILQHQIKKYRESSCCHRFTFVCSQVHHENNNGADCSHGETMYTAGSLSACCSAQVTPNTLTKSMDLESRRQLSFRNGNIF